MSIFSDHDCGALSDSEFENECTMMNNREAVYEMELERRLHEEDEEYEDQY